MPARLHHVLLALGFTVLMVACALLVLEVRRHGMTCGYPFGQVQEWRYSDTATLHACQAAIDDRRAHAMALACPGAVLSVSGIVAAIISSRHRGH